MISKGKMLYFLLNMEADGTDEGGWGGQGGRDGGGRDLTCLRTRSNMEAIEADRGGIEADGGILGKIGGVWADRGCCGGWGRGG